MNDEDDYIVDFSEMATPKPSVDLPDERAIQELRRKVESMGRKLNLQEPKLARAPAEKDTGENASRESVQASKATSSTKQAPSIGQADAAHEAAHGNSTEEATEAARIAAESFLSSLQLDRDERATNSVYVATRSSGGSLSAPTAPPAAAPKRTRMMASGGATPPSASLLRPPQDPRNGSPNSAKVVPSSASASLTSRKFLPVAPPKQAPQAKLQVWQSGPQAQATLMAGAATASALKTAPNLNHAAPNSMPRQPQQRPAAAVPAGLAPRLPRGSAVKAAMAPESDALLGTLPQLQNCGI